MKTFLQTTFLLTCVCVASQAHEITLTVNLPSPLGSVKLSDQIVVEANEVAEIKSLYGPGGGVGCALYFLKDGITNSLSTTQLVGGGSSFPMPLPTIAGPATIRLTAENGSATCFCTVKIEPESFPPDKTIIIPQNTPGANIIMEQSSDLVHWTNSVPGLYTNTTITSMFFRLRADRL